MECLLLVLGLAALFYIIVPGIGAFLVRYRWRTFRRRTIEASLLPAAGYNQMRRAADAGAGEYLGEFRFIGSLEAIQGNDIMWLNDGSVSFAVDMKGQTVALLPSAEGGSPPENESPHLIPWRKLTHLTEGVRLLVAGGFYGDDGRGLFRGTNGKPLVAVMYGGPDATMLRRAIYSGRQRNEYWNQLTPASLAAGALALLTAAYVTLSQPGTRFEGLLAVTFSIVPIAPLFPPGFVLFFLYRRLWRRGRALRAERDVVTLPLRHFPDNRADGLSIRLATGERYAAASIPPRFAGAFTERGATAIALSKHAEKLRDEDRYFVFGGVASDGRLQSPRDPLAELIVIPGDPRSLATQCERQARRLEVLSVFLAAVGILANLYIVLLLLSNVLR